MNKKSRFWVFGFLAVIAAGLAIYMGINYYADPLGYFTNEKKVDHYFSDDFTRAIKARYLKNHKDEIEAVVMGGSKAGVIDPARLTAYTGLNYYNLYMNMGNFSDYLDFTRFLIDEVKIRELTLSLSSFETVRYDRSNTGSNYKKPALLVGNLLDQTGEFLSNLMLDQKTVREAFDDRVPRRTDTADNLYTGMRNRKANTASAFSNHDLWVQNKVLKKFEKNLEKLFSGELQTEQEEVRQANLAALREIKRLCDEHGVTLKVFIGASFLGDRYFYECPGYYSYLAMMVDILGEVWDFSAFNDVNRNPYNFYDPKHYSRGIADQMVDIMYGREEAGEFGVLLTPDNVYPYLEKRRADFEELKKEFEQTGTLALLTKEDPSFREWTVDPAWNLENTDPEEFEYETETEEP